MDNRRIASKVNTGWAGMAVALMLGVFTLAWTGRGAVRYLETHGALKIAVAAVAFTGAGALILAVKRLPGATPARAMAALALFAVSQALSFSITRTLAESIHTVEYEALSFFLYHALKNAKQGWRLYATVMALVLIAGWSDEAMQYFVPDRYYDPLDVALNAVSGGFGLVIAAVLAGGPEEDER